MKITNDPRVFAFEDVSEEELEKLYEVLGELCGDSILDQFYSALEDKINELERRPL